MFVSLPPRFGCGMRVATLATMWAGCVATLRLPCGPHCGHTTATMWASLQRGPHCNTPASRKSYARGALCFLRLLFGVGCVATLHYRTTATTRLRRLLFGGDCAVKQLLLGNEPNSSCSATSQTASARQRAFAYYHAAVCAATYLQLPITYDNTGGGRCSSYSWVPGNELSYLLQLGARKRAVVHVVMGPTKLGDEPKLHEQLS